MTFLSTIASTLGAIVGILIAVALVSYELLRTSFATYATQEILRSAIVRHVLTLYVVTLTVAIGTVAQIGETVSPRAAALTWVVIVLSGCCMLALIPVSKFILRSATPSRARITEMVHELDRRSLARLDYLHRYPVADQLEVMESHPMFVLRELALRSIAEKDQITPRAIISECGEQILRLMGPSNDEHESDFMRNIYGSFLMLLKPVGLAALEERNESLLRTLVALYGEVHGAAAGHKAEWADFIELDEWVEELLRAAAKMGLDSFVSSASWVLEQVYKEHLEQNVPVEADVWIFHDVPSADADHKKMLQWENMSTRHPDMLARVAAAALEHGHVGIATTPLLAFGRMISSIEGLTTLGNAQKQSAIRRLYYHIQQVLITSAAKAGSVPILGLLGIGHISTMRSLEQDSPWARTGLLTGCATVLQLGRMKKLESRTLNELGTVARGCIGKINHAPRYAEAVLLVVQTFSKLVEENGGSGTASEPNVLAALDEQLESFERWFASKDVTHELIQSEIQRGRARIHESGALRHPAVLPLTWPTIGGSEPISSIPVT